MVSVFALHSLSIFFFDCVVLWVFILFSFSNVCLVFHVEQNSVSLTLSLHWPFSGLCASFSCLLRSFAHALPSVLTDFCPVIQCHSPNKFILRPPLKHHSQVVLVGPYHQTSLIRLNLYWVITLLLLSPHHTLWVLDQQTDGSPKWMLCSRHWNMPSNSFLESEFQIGIL